DRLLKRVVANTAVGFQERFAVLSLDDVEIQNVGDDVRDLVAGKRGTEDFTQGRFFTGVAAQGNLEEFVAFVVHAQNADVADVVVTTGVHAVGNVQVDFAQIVQIIQIVKAHLNGFRHRNGFGVGQGAEVAARAADHIGQQAQSRRRQPQGFGLLPQ